MDEPIVARKKNTKYRQNISFATHSGQFKAIFSFPLFNLSFNWCNWPTRFLLFYQTHLFFFSYIWLIVSLNSWFHLTLWLMCVCDQNHYFLCKPPRVDFTSFIFNDHFDEHHLFDSWDVPSISGFHTHKTLSSICFDVEFSFRSVFIIISRIAYRKYTLNDFRFLYFHANLIGSLCGVALIASFACDCCQFQSPFQPMAMPLPFYTLYSDNV